MLTGTLGETKVQTCSDSSRTSNVSPWAEGHVTVKVSF